MKHIANIALLLGVLLLVGLLGTIIYCWCTYANAPITDIPAWALFFMWVEDNGKKRRFNNTK